MRQIAVDRIMRGGLVGHRMRPHAAPVDFGENIRRIAEQADRDRRFGVRHDLQRLIQTIGLPVDIAGAQPHFDARWLAFNRKAACARHRRGQRLCAAHAAQPAGQDPFARQVAAIMLAAHFDEGLIGALHDALRADVDPRARRHLAIHHQARRDRVRGNAPTSPIPARGWSWRARRAAHPCGFGTRRPACPTGSAGSGHPPAACSVSTILS